MSNTAQRLREAMQLTGMKQIDLIEKTGISKGALSSYLSGRYEPKQNNLFAIANVMGINPAWLMGLDVPMILPPVTNSSLTDEEKELLSLWNNATPDIKPGILATLRANQRKKDVVLLNVTYEKP